MHTHPFHAHEPTFHEPIDACFVARCTRIKRHRSSTPALTAPLVHGSPSARHPDEALRDAEHVTKADDIRLIRTTGLPSAERRAVERAAKRGELERIRPGVLVEPGSLDGLYPNERHVVLVRASSSRLRQQDVLSHESACAVLGLPYVGQWPAKVHVSDPTTTHTRVTAWFVRHGAGNRPPTGTLDRHGLRSTTAARTVVDIAATRPLLGALPVLDHALRTVASQPSELQRETERLEKGHAKAALALGMGSALSESPAESVCRVRFRQVGAPEPEQQHVFSRHGERTAVVDFWFPAQGVVVEVDGRSKYSDDPGRSTADAHWQEKRREDFIRSFPEVRFVVRLSWSDLMDPDRVRTALVRAGVPCR